MSPKNNNKKEALSQMLLEDPNDPFLLFALAKEHEKLEENSEAMSLYERLSKEHTAYVGTYYHFGQLLSKLEQKELALETYSRGIEIANQQKDHHAASELMNAKTNLEIE